MRDLRQSHLQAENGKGWNLLPIICLGCNAKAWFKAYVDLSLDMQTFNIPFVAN